MKSLKAIGLAVLAVFGMCVFAASVITTAFSNSNPPSFAETVGVLAVIALALAVCSARAVDRSPRRRLALKVHRQIHTDSDADHNQGNAVDNSRMKNRLAFQ